MKRRQVDWENESGSFLFVILWHPVQFYRFWCDEWQKNSVLYEAEKIVKS